MKERLKKLTRFIPGQRAGEKKQESPPKKRTATGGIRGLGVGAK